jgi:hypothetical protein
MSCYRDDGIEVCQCISCRVKYSEFNRVASSFEDDVMFEVSAYAAKDKLVADANKLLKTTGEELQ